MRSPGPVRQRWLAGVRIALVVGALACFAQVLAGTLRADGAPIARTPKTATPATVPAARLTRLPDRPGSGDRLAANASLAPAAGTPHESSVDFADPFVLRTRWGYVAYATNNSDANVPTRRSTDLETWRPGGDALPRLPAWATAGGTWAPAVVPSAGGFLMYVGFHTVTGRECIATAVATNPLGPFTVNADMDRACIVWNAIDPSPFVDTDGSHWLLYKVDAGYNTIAVQPMTADGLALTGSPVALLRPTQVWEAGNVEGPSLAAPRRRLVSPVLRQRVLDAHVSHRCRDVRDAAGSVHAERAAVPRGLRQHRRTRRRGVGARRRARDDERRVRGADRRTRRRGHYPRVARDRHHRAPRLVSSRQPGDSLSCASTFCRTQTILAKSKRWYCWPGTCTARPSAPDDTS